MFMEVQVSKAYCDKIGSLRNYEEEDDNFKKQ